MNTVHAQKSFWLSRYMLIGVVFGIITTLVSILLSSLFLIATISSTLWGIFAFLYFYLIGGKRILRWRSLIWFAMSGISLYISLYLFINNYILIGLSGSIIVLFGFFLSDFGDKKNIPNLDVALTLAIGLIASYAIHLPEMNLPAYLYLSDTSLVPFLIWQSPFLIWQTGMLLVLGNMVYKRKD